MGRPQLPIVHGTYAGYQSHARHEPGPVTCDPCVQAAHTYRNARWAYRRIHGPSERQLRQKAMVLLAKRHDREMAWLVEQIRQGRI